MRFTIVCFLLLYMFEFFYYKIIGKIGYIGNLDLLASQSPFNLLQFSFCLTLSLKSPIALKCKLLWCFSGSMLRLPSLVSRTGRFWGSSASVVSIPTLFQGPLYSDHPLSDNVLPFVFWPTHLTWFLGAPTHSLGSNTPL